MKRISTGKLGSLVEKKRVEKGLAQEELGDKTKINRQVVGRIENKKYIPSIIQLNSLMEILEFDLADIAEEVQEQNVFVAMMGKAGTAEEEKWLETMVTMMLCLRKHTRIRNAMTNETAT